VSCRSAVHDSRIGPLKRQLVEGGDQAGLIPGPYAGGAEYWGGANAV
jgi:hypothetical protein